tara:strand:+ start:300 stop:494 length:195 start_codon:yes stop_codon:yes gene_type:complete
MEKLFVFYLAFFKYRFFVLASSDVNNKINMVPTKNEKISVKPTTSTISLGRYFRNIMNRSLILT